MASIWDARRERILRKMAGEGFTAVEIAERLGVDDQTVRDRARRLGVKFAPPLGSRNAA